MPGIVLPGILFTIVALWPFVEARITARRSRAPPARPIRGSHPVRTASGLAILTIFGVLTLAGGNDVLAFYFSTDVETLTVLFRCCRSSCRSSVWLIAWQCRPAPEREAAPTSRATTCGRLGPRVRRSASGGFEEVEP